MRNIILLLLFIAIALKALANDNKVIDISLDDSTKISNLINLANSEFKSDFEEANKTINSAIDIARESKNHRGLVDCYYSKGMFYQHEIRYDLALENFQMGLLFVENLTDSLQRKQMKLKIYFAIGNSFVNLKIFPKALEFFQKAEKIREELGSIKFKREIHSSFASIYSELGDFEKSNKIWLKISKESVNDTIVVLSAVYFNICNNFLLQKNYDSILIYGEKGLDYCETRVDKKHKEDLLSIMSTAYLHLGKYNNATQYSDSAIILASENNRKKLLLFLYLNKGKLNIAIGNSHIAEQLFIQTYKGAGELNLAHIQNQATEELNKFYYRKGDFSKAYYYQKRNIDLSDSLELIKNLPLVNFLLAKSQFEMMQEKLKYQFLLKKKEIETRNYQTLLKSIIAFLFSILLVVILYSLYLKQRSTIRKAKVAKDKFDLEMKQMEKLVTSNAINKIRITESIKESADQLKSLKIYLNDVNLNKLNLVIRNLLNTLNQGDDKEFELYFNKVHPNFYINLKTTFPNLSQNELKLCAFIRLNLSSKQIGAIINITPESVKTSRSRLRKKLNISNSDINLFSFLSNF